MPAVPRRVGRARRREWARPERRRGTRPNVSRRGRYAKRRPQMRPPFASGSHLITPKGATALCYATHSIRQLEQKIEHRQLEQIADPVRRLPQASRQPTLFGALLNENQDAEPACV